MSEPMSMLLWFPSSRDNFTRHVVDAAGWPICQVNVLGVGGCTMANEIADAHNKACFASIAKLGERLNRSLPI